MDLKGTIAVTGGTGFLGYHLVPELIRSGYRVKLLKRRGSFHPNVKEYPEGVSVVEVDFEVEPDQIAKACSGCIGIIHAAGLVSYDLRDQPRMYETHVTLTRKMLQAARIAQVRRFVHVSSIVTIGHGRIPRDEQSPYNAEGLRLAYWATKLEAEKIALAANSKELNVIVVNPGSLLGKGEKNGQLLPFIEKLIGSERPILPDGGSDFLDCADAAKGVVLGLERGRPGERYILGSQNLTYAEFHKRLRGAFGKESRPIVLPRALLQVVAKCLELFERISGIDLPVNSARLRRVNGVYMFHDLAKAKNELGVSPGPIEPALRLMLEK